MHIIKFKTILKLIFVPPIRVLIKFLEFIFKDIIPIFGAILTSIPINIIFIGGVAAIVLLWVFADVVTFALMQYLDIMALFNNVYNVALNLILNTVYDWGVPHYNDLMDFILFVIKSIWQGLCQGTTEISEVVECSGILNLLLSIEFTFVALYKYFTFILFIIQLLSAFMQSIICTDLECSNIVNEGFYNEGVYNKGPYNKGVYNERSYNEEPHNENKAYFTYQEYITSESFEQIEGIQIFVKVVVALIQVIIEYIIPALIILYTFILDTYSIFLYYFLQLTVVIFATVSRTLSMISFFIMRAVNSVSITNVFLGNTSLSTYALDFDPDFYAVNMSDWTDNRVAAIGEQIEDSILGNLTDIYLYQLTDFPNHVDMINFLIRVYFILLDVINYVIQAIGLPKYLVDKVLCISIFFRKCLGLDVFICDTMFKPPVVCAPIATYEKVNNIWNYTGFVVYDFVDALVEGGFATARSCSDGYIINNKSTGEYYDLWYDEDTNGDSPPYVYPYDGSVIYGKRWNNISCFGLGAVESKIGAGIADPPNPFPNKADIICGNPYTGEENSCQFHRGHDGIHVGEYLGRANPEDVKYGIVSEDIRYCGDVYELEKGGVFFPYEGETFDNIIDFVTSSIGLPIVWPSMQGDLMDATRNLYLTCQKLVGSASDSPCPCTKCESHPSQLLHFLDFIPFFKGWPCNPEHPDPAKTCCIKEPYRSSLWTWDVIYEFLGFDLLNEADIAITSRRAMAIDDIDSYVDEVFSKQHINMLAFSL